MNMKKKSVEIVLTNLNLWSKLIKFWSNQNAWIDIHPEGKVHNFSHEIRDHSHSFMTRGGGGQHWKCREWEKWPKICNNYNSIHKKGIVGLWNNHLGIHRLCPDVKKNSLWTSFSQKKCFMICIIVQCQIHFPSADLGWECSFYF